MDGWNLPPGCTDKMIDDHFGGKEPEPDGNYVVRRIDYSQHKDPDDGVMVDAEEFTNEAEAKKECDYYSKKYGYAEVFDYDRDKVIYSK